MVRGGISLRHRTREHSLFSDRTPLHLVQGRLTGVAHRDKIARPLVLTVLPALPAVGNGAIFMDDDAPCHRAVVLNKFLQQQGVMRLDLPARSPDLNPIEHV